MIVQRDNFLWLITKLFWIGVMLASPLLLFAQEQAQEQTVETQSQTQMAAARDPGRVWWDRNLFDSDWWKGTAFDGYASLSYTYNTNDPDNGLNQFRVFDFNDDEPQLDVAQIVVQHPISEPGQFGFRLNLMAGAGVPEITAAYGMFRNTETGVAHHFDIPEVYLSYLAPLGKGLRFDLGKFATHLGYEVIGGYDGYNDNFSRGFIFGYGEPFTHTGLKLGYPFSKRVTSALLITNGCDAVTRLNGGITVGGQVSVATSKTTSVIFNFLHGPERPHNDHDQRSLYELIGTWKVTSRLSLAYDALYADEDHAAIDGSDAIWKGLALYSKYSLAKQLSLAFRGEIFGDDGGSRTGTSQTLHAFTLTPEYYLPVSFSRVISEFRHFDGKFVTRGEFRQDFSDHATFRKGNGYTTRQFTTAVNLIYLF